MKHWLRQHYQWWDNSIHNATCNCGEKLKENNIGEEKKAIFNFVLLLIFFIFFFFRRGGRGKWHCFRDEMFSSKVTSSSRWHRLDGLVFFEDNPSLPGGHRSLGSGFTNMLFWDNAFLSGSGVTWVRGH